MKPRTTTSTSARLAPRSRARAIQQPRPRPTARVGLSKSRYLSGLQCPLRLWLDTYAPDEAAPTDAATQARFDAGHEVGVVARRRHPGGVLVDEDHRHLGQAIARTRDLLDERAVPALFEAGFCEGRVVIRADILVRAGRGAWDLVEVKSGAKVKDPNLDDLAVQLWVLNKAGLRIRRAGILTLNTRYVYQGGDHDVDALFTLHDRTAEARGKAREVEQNVQALLRMLAADEAPAIEPGEQCSKPYDCPYFEHCTRGLAPVEHPIAELPRLMPPTRRLLEGRGMASILDIPLDWPLTERQELVRRCVLAGEPWQARGFKKALREVRWPLYHLDFETFMPALPLYAGTRPYQAIPFQWSCHVEQRDGSLEHRMFLAFDDADPREAFARTLIEAVGRKGTICVYSSYERSLLRQLARDLPELGDALQNMISRLWDLHKVLREHYYHPDFAGSYSLKHVLPALVPALGYGDLEIQDGQAAGAAHLEAITTDDEARRRELQGQLIDYCTRDTLAMVEVRRALLGAAS